MTDCQVYIRDLWGNYAFMSYNTYIFNNIMYSVIPTVSNILLCLKIFIHLISASNIIYINILQNGIDCFLFLDGITVLKNFQLLISLKF